MTSGGQWSGDGGDGGVVFTVVTLMWVDNGDCQDRGDCHMC